MSVIPERSERGPTDAGIPHRRLELRLLRAGHAAAAVVLTLAGLAWAGWATGVQALTSIHPDWPPMKPWTAVWLAALAVAILVQSGSPSPARIRLGRGLVAVVGVTTATVLAEYATGRKFGVDPFWFGDAVRHIQPALPGRPSPQTVSSALLLSVPVALSRANRPRAQAAWAGCLAAAMVMPFVTIVAYLFGAVVRFQIASSTGMALTTAVSLLLLGAASVLVRPGGLLARSDPLSLIRLGTILAGFPLLVGLTRRGLLGLSVRDDLALTIATAVGTVVLGTAAYRLSRREQELSESRESDRTLLRASLDGMLDPQVLLDAVRDSSGQVTDFVYRELNQATCDYLGLSRGDLLGHSLLDISPSVAESGLLAAYIRCSTTGEPVVIDDMSYDNEILAQTRRYDLRATRATPTTITLTWRDVTDRFRLMQRVAESEAEARTLMDSAAVAMNVSGPDGRFVKVNAAMCDLVGYDAKTLLQMTWQELTAPGDLDADLANFARITAGEIDSYRMTKRYVHADGHLIWGDLTVRCLRAPNGDVDQIIGQVIDVTNEVDLARRLQVKADSIASELRSAAAYVSSILPADLEGPVRVSSRYLPSQELAGDIFDYRWLDDDHLIVYLIDVSGHGVSPALLSVSVHNLLRSGSLPLSTLLAPEQVLTELNRLFQMDQQDAKYMTMWVGVYEVSSRTLRYASAGAPPAIAVGTGAGGPVAELSTGGQPLGMFDDAVYTSHDHALPPGHRMLLYSDGAYELALDAGRQLTLAEFTSMFTRLAESPGFVLDDLVKALRKLTPSGDFEDDCSLVLIQFD